MAGHKMTWKEAEKTEQGGKSEYHTLLPPRLKTRECEEGWNNWLLGNKEICGVGQSIEEALQEEIAI